MTEIETVDLRNSVLGKCFQSFMLLDRTKEERLDIAGLFDLFDSASVGIFCSTEEGALLSVSPYCAKLFGFESTEEMIGERSCISSWFHGDLDKAQKFHQRLKSNRQLSGFEAQVMRKDGTTRYVGLSAHLITTENESPFVAGTVSDISKRVFAEEALRHSEQKWRSLAQNSGDFIIIVDCDGIITFTNRLASEPGHVRVGNSIFGHMPTESAERLKCIISSVFRTGEINAFDLNEATPGGFSGWYEARAVPIWSEGVVTGVILVCTEITNQKRTENELRASQRFIERVADTSPDILYVYDLLDRTFVYANHQIWRILGITVNELREMGPIFLEDHTHPDDLHLLKERLKILKNATDSDVFECEYRIRHKKGEWRWLNSRDTIFTRTPDGRPHQILGTARDITERKRTRDALRESEDRFRILVETTNVVPWEADLESNQYLYVGPQAGPLLGCEPAEWYAPGFWAAHVHPDDRAWTNSFRRKSAMTLRGFELEYRMIAKSGKTLWVKEIVHPRVDSGSASRIGGFIIDITNRRKVEDELQKSHEQLRALAARGQRVREAERIRIAREIHDELGQSLTALKIDLCWLEAQDRTDSEEFKQKVVEISSTIDGTIEAVRRIATELRPPVLDHLGLAEAVEWQAQEFEKRFGHTVSLDVDGDIAIADSELATAIFRIFQEILTNVVRHAQARRVDISLRLDSGHLVLEVADDGKGFSGNEKRASLGLLGMKERAHIFGGVVNFSSVPQKGTTVTVTIPRSSLAGCNVENFSSSYLPFPKSSPS